MRAPMTTAEPARTRSRQMLTHRLVGRDHRSRCSRPPRVSVPTGMLEIIINKLPGGDASRTQPLARITLTNTGAGTGGVRIYDARITHAEERVDRRVDAHDFFHIIAGSFGEIRVLLIEL